MEVKHHFIRPLMNSSIKTIMEITKLQGDHPKVIKKLHQRMLIPFIAQTTTIKELLWNWSLDIVF